MRLLSKAQSTQKFQNHGMHTVVLAVDCGSVTIVRGPKVEGDEIGVIIIVIIIIIIIIALLANHHKDHLNCF